MNIMTTITTLAVREIENEGRILDTDLGAALGYEKPSAIRQLIARHMDALLALGGLPHRVENPGAKGGRPSMAYWLNEQQALYITLKSNTPTAQTVTVEVIKVFTAWRHGKLVPAQPLIPNFTDPEEAAVAWLEEQYGSRAPAAGSVFPHPTYHRASLGRSRRPPPVRKGHPSGSPHLD